MIKNIKNYIRKFTDPGSRGQERSEDWFEVRRKHLEKEPKCKSCGGTKKLEVHHIIPFSVDSSLELEDSNLITLCRGNKSINCHLVIGHNLSFRDYNKEVKEDADRLFKKISIHTKNKNNENNE